MEELLHSWEVVERRMASVLKGHESLLQQYEDKLQGRQAATSKTKGRTTRCNASISSCDSPSEPVIPDFISPCKSEPVAVDNFLCVEAHSSEGPTVKPGPSKLEYQLVSSYSKQIEDFLHDIRQVQQSADVGVSGNKSDVQALLGDIRLKAKRGSKDVDSIDLSEGLWSTVRFQVRHLLSNRNFEMSLAAVIVLNAAFIGVQANSAMVNDTESENLSFTAIEWIFSFVFTIEMTLRIIAQGLSTFSVYNHDFFWNSFDFTLVISAWMDRVLASFLADKPNVGAIRLFRIMRLVRVLRIVRVMRFFRDLRRMVAGIASSLYAMMWALFLMAFVMYIAAVCILQFAVVEKTDQSAGAGSLSPDMYANLLSQFSDLRHAMITLYMSILGGVDWGNVLDPLMAMNPAIGCGFICYVSFCVLCLLNVIVAVFVENSDRMRQADSESTLIERLEAHEVWIAELTRIFHSIDVDGDEFITCEEFVKFVANDVSIMAWFAGMGIDVSVHNPESIFTMLDLDRSGGVTLEEFTLGLKHMQGAPQSIDVSKLSCDAYNLGKQVAALAELCSFCFDKCLSIADAHDERKPPLERRKSVGAGGRYRHTLGAKPPVSKMHVPLPGEVEEGCCPILAFAGDF